MNRPLDDRLSGYLDGELDASTHAQVDAELASSDELRAELAAVDRARQMVRSLPPVEPPHALVPDELASRRRSRSWRGASALVGVAAVAVVVWIVAASPFGDPLRIAPPLDDLAARHAAALDGTPPGSKPMDPSEMADLGPDMPDDEMVMTGAFERDGVVQLVYEHDDETISVFHQEGGLDTAAMPPDGDTMDIDGRSGWHGTAAGVPVLVVESGGSVYTILGDASDSTMLHMAESL